MASNFLRMLQSAFARRLAFVIVAAVLAWLGMGNAYARDPGVLECSTRSTTSCTTLQEALDYAKLQSTANMHCVNYGHTDAKGYSLWKAKYVSHSVSNEGTAQEVLVVSYTDVAPNGAASGCSSAFFYWTAKDCAAQPALGAGSWSGVNPDTLEMCKDSCTYAGQGGVCVSMTVDSKLQTYCSDWTPTGGSCSYVGQAGGGIGSPSPSDGDGDGTSDGSDASPNNPGQGGSGPGGAPGQDGSGNPSGGAGSGPGGTQGNGPGEGSGNGNTSGGGGNCATPPASTGDAILAQIAFQTWATRCAVEKQGKKGEGEGEDGTDSTPVPFNDGEEAQDDSEEPGEVPSHTFDIPSMLDMSGFLGGGGSCPDFGSITMGPFGTHSLGGQWFCDWLPILRALIILMATGTAIKILLGYNA